MKRIGASRSGWMWRRHPACDDLYQLCKHCGDRQHIDKLEAYPTVIERYWH